SVALHMPVASTVPLAFVWVKCPMPSMMALGWTLNSPSPVIATRSPFDASETFGSSSRNAYVWVALSASAVAGNSIETASVRIATSTDALFIVLPLFYCQIAMCPDLSGAIVPRPLGNDIAPMPRRTTSSRCIATPAPPAVCRDVYGTFGTVAVRTSPAAVFPTTWIVAVPLKLAIPPERVTGPETDPLTCICETLAHGPNGNPPERPAITQRNSPPDDDAVNPSCDVVPRSPSTMPPPLTLGSDAYALVCEARIVLIAKHKPMTTRRQTCFTNTSPSARADCPPV